MLRTLATIGVILWIVVGMAELVSLAPLPKEQITQNSKEDHKPTQCDEKGSPSLISSTFCYVGGFVDTYHDDISAVSTVVIAAFTAILGFFTVSLARSTRRAADAARTSAISAERALEQTSEPYLDVAVSLKDAVVNRLPGKSAVIHFVGSYFAEYIVHNYGQGTGIVLEIYQYCGRWPGLPREIPFPPTQSNLRKVFTVGGQKTSEPIPIVFPKEGFDNLYEGPPIWVSLQIRYRDVFGNQYISTYCAAFSPHSATFTAYGGQDYNGRRKLTDEERRVAEERDAIL